MEPISHANAKAGSALVCSAAEDIEATAAALVLRRMLQQQNVGLTRALSLLEELPESQALDELVRMTSSLNFLIVLLSPVLAFSVRCAAVLRVGACGDMPVVPVRFCDVTMPPKHEFLEMLGPGLHDQSFMALCDQDLGANAMCDLIYGDAREFSVRSSLADLMKQACGIARLLVSGHRPRVAVSLSARGVRHCGKHAREFAFMHPKAR